MTVPTLVPGAPRPSAGMYPDRLLGMSEPVCLPDTCWGPLPRSRELTPRWVERYRGPRRGAGDEPHACHELTVVLRGRLALHVGIRHRLGPGDAVLVPAGLAHREDAAGDPDTVWIGLDGVDLPTVPVVAAGGRLAVLTEELWLAALARGPGSGPIIDGLARAVLGETLRQSGGGGDVVDQAIAHLLRHHDRRIVIAELAAGLGVSAGWLFRAFRRRTGVTPQAFLQRERMTRAGHLLSAGGLSVARVAELVGFADPLYFSRAFRRHHGRPPSALRG